MSRHLARYGVVVIALVVLCSCAVRLGYNTLNFWIPYYLSDYVTLTSSQKQVFGTALDQALANHRRQELPKIHRQLMALQTSLIEPLSYGGVRYYHDVFTRLGQDSAAMLAGPLAAVVKTFSSQQAGEMSRKFEARLNEILTERDPLSAAEKQRKRAARLADRAEDWIGRLSPEQRKLLEELAGYQVEMEPVFVSVWQDFLRNWSQLLATRAQPNLEGRMRALLQDLVAFRYPAKQAELDFYLNRRFELLSRLHHTMTERQQRHLDEKLTSLRKDVAVLINES
ncbi:DUF6279 family lipoprotein [Photobacterium atrarenae]|uniref:DUF6279 family lipoprotein n=1 Tax=Photobacterium atrarenae TaxID=865757 RepID=A0ABY5GJ33_9GAMM|nr:DUF6279 family lipoprotein [Photobacterium atrarenae]UTV28719.1 DUF6279 family lipoprotein [Photobacterium atrarenae]